MTVKRYTPTQCCEHDGTYVTYSDYQKLVAENAALKAKLANPIVLHVIPNLNGDEWCWKDEVIKAINVAGFTVKGYSPEQSVFVGARP